MQQTNPPFPAVLRRIEAGGIALALFEHELSLMQRGTVQTVALEHVSKIQSEAGRLAVYSADRLALAADVSPFDVDALTLFFSEVRKAVTLLRNRIRIEADRIELVGLKVVKAQSGELSPSELESFAEDHEAEVRRAVTQNPRVPSWILGRLARDENDAVREAVACHERTPSELIEGLLTDSDAEVRSSARTNLVRSLARAALDGDARVRLSAARNQHTPAESLAALGQDHEETVRDSALENSSHPSYPERNHLPSFLLPLENPVPLEGLDDVSPDLQAATDTLASEIAQEYGEALKNGLRVEFSSAPDGRALLATLMLEESFPRALNLRAFCEGTDRVYPPEETLELNPGGSAFIVFVPNGRPSNWLLEVQEIGPLRQVRLAPPVSRAVTR